MPRNWDDYYSIPANLACDPEPLLVQAADLLIPGYALDLACGAGRNALHLARLGWRVTAVDASPVATRLLRERAALQPSGALPIDTRTADLEKREFEIAPVAFDLICDFFYLQRDLFPSIREGVRPGGVFTGAIHLFDENRTSAFVMRPGELRREFDGWKIVYYSEAGATASAGCDSARRAARIIARRA